MNWFGAFLKLPSYSSPVPLPNGRSHLRTYLSSFRARMSEPQGLPPSYNLATDQDVLLSDRHSIDQFDYEEPEASPSSSSTFSPRRIHDKFITPVQRMILDPIAAFFRSIRISFDSFIARYGNPLIIKRLLYLFFVFFLIYIAFETGIIPGADLTSGGGGFSYDRNTLDEFLTNVLDEDEGNVAHRIEYLSSMPHLAGTAGDLAFAKYVEDEMMAFGIKQVALSTHEAYVTYPNTTEGSLSLELVGTETKVTGRHGNDDPQPFHSLSAAGDVTGPLIYVGLGEKQDYERLKQAGVNLENSIFVIKKGGPLSTGLKIHLAQSNGAVGVVTTVEGTEEPERSSVGIPEIVPGDVLTPGYSSFASERAIDLTDVQSLTHIPAIPISWKDLNPFLSALEGKGTKTDDFWSGDASSPKARLVNYPVVKPRHPLWNVKSKLEGLEQDELVVILGARRDSWCRGASASASGTVVLLEVARAFTAMASQLKWAPLRSLYFASWDGHDENFAGTTEWVEYNGNTLRQTGVVYVNLDEAITGDILDIKGHPMLGPLVDQVVSEISANETLNWRDGKVKPYNGVGDYSPFLSYVGTVSLDVGFKHDQQDDIVVGGCSDTSERFLSRHRDRVPTLSKIVSRLILRLCDDPVIPFDLGSYADALDEYTTDLESYAKTKTDTGIDVSLLREATAKMRDIYTQFTLWRDGWMTLVATSGEAPAFMHFRWAWNARLINIDKHLLDYQGIPGRKWFKHVVFGPQLWPESNNFMWGTFPAARDAIEKGDWNAVKEAVDRIGAILLIAASKLGL